MGENGNDWSVYSAVTELFGLEQFHACDMFNICLTVLELGKRLVVVSCCSPV